MRLRNFSRFDLFSSFHMRVNCWFLKSSTIDGTAPRLGGNTVGVRDGQSVLPVAEDNRSEENLVHKPFSRSRLGTQYVKVTITSSPTVSIRYTFSGNFAGRSFGWPVRRSQAPLQSLHTTATLSRSTWPSVSMAHLYVHASSTQ